MFKSVCRRYDMDLRDERELAFQRLLTICQSGLVSITDFRSGFCFPAYDFAADLLCVCSFSGIYQWMLSS